MKVFVAIWALLLLMAQVPGAVAAPNDKQLKVEKLVEKGNAVSVGDDVIILLKFTNPFGRELPIRIVDKNAFGSNGIDIQCMEYTVPGQRETTVAYDPIKPFKSGTYAIGAAEVSYTNPATGGAETVKSNTLDVSVNDSTTSVRQGSAQGMTAIYRCGGMNMQSTSYSSSSGTQTGSQQQQQQQQQPNQQQSESQQSRVQNNQMNQNAQAVKQQMGEQLAQQKRAEGEFQQNLAKNRQFREKHEDILKAGYTPSSASVEPSTNDTGRFEISYKNQNGETASLKGEMENGTMKSIMSQNSKDVQNMLDRLRQNAAFRKYERQLAMSGFNQSMQPTINQMSQERTEITLPYKNGATGGERHIAAEYVNGTLQKVSMEAEDGKRDEPYLRLFLLAIMAALGWTIYSRVRKRGQQVVALGKKAVTTSPRDYAKEAEEMIAEGERLFGIGREKDAYEKVSQAVRFYFSHKLGLGGRELTNTELLSFLKPGKKLHSGVQECLNMCGMVEFAKYEPCAEDFGKITGSARDFITHK